MLIHSYIAVNFLPLAKCLNLYFMTQLLEIRVNNKPIYVFPRERRSVSLFTIHSLVNHRY